VAVSAVRGALYSSGSQLFDSRGAVPMQLRAEGYALTRSAWPLGSNWRST
jgi:hypothetical protein